MTADDDKQQIKHASSLLIYEMRDNKPFFLMGRRHPNHAFMPNVHVFPGGRVEESDQYVRVFDHMIEQDANRLQSELDMQANPKAVNAIALCAIRETWEETGILVGVEDKAAEENGDHPHWGAFAARNVLPSISSLRYFARAITPPGRVRRFDTRFFLMPRNDFVIDDTMAPSNELLDLDWVGVEQIEKVKLHPITVKIMQQAATRLQDDPQAIAPMPVAFYKHGIYTQTID